MGNALDYCNALDEDGRRAPREVKKACWKICEQAGKGNYFNALAAMAWLTAELVKGLKESQNGGQDE